MLIGLILMVGCAQATASGGQAQSQTRLDPRAVVMPAEELPSGFALDAGRTVFEERTDGTIVHEAVYTRSPSQEDQSSPATLKFAVGRLGSVRTTVEQFAAVRQAYQQGGWKERGVALLGDEATGFGLEGGPTAEASYLYLFRFGKQLIGATVTGAPASTSFDQALGYAVRLSSRLDSALAALPPDPPETASEPLPSVVIGSTPPPQTVQTAAEKPQSTSQGNRAVTEPSLMLDAKLDDGPEVGAGLRLGGFSGLFALDRDGKTFVSLTDRGPNGEIEIKGKKQMTFPVPSYTPRIIKLRQDSGQIKVVETIQLRLADGYTDTVTSSREISGLPNSESAGEVPYELGGKDRLPFDPYGVDTEGITIDPRDGSYWIAEEYGPSILHVAPDGTILLRAVPEKLDLDAPGQNVRQILPSVLTKRKANRGFEGIAISPDGSRVFAMLQSPLQNPDKKAGEASRHIRLIVLDTSDGTAPRLVGTYVYLAESASDVGAKEQDDIKIGDLAALSNTQLLVGERDSEEGGWHKMVYAIDLANATNLVDRGDINGKTLEQHSRSDLEKAGVRYVQKAMVVDLAKLGYRPDKLEGLAIIDQNTLAVINDNDFGIGSIDDKNRIIKNNVPSRLALIRVPELPR